MEARCAELKRAEVYVQDLAPMFAQIVQVVLKNSMVCNGWMQKLLQGDELKTNDLRNH